MCILCEMNKRKKNGIGVEVHTQFAARLNEAAESNMKLTEYMKGKHRWGSLHGHSEFSLLDGGAKVEDILDKAKAMGQDFVAITDHGNMFSAARAHKHARKIGIKHIVGCELYLTPVGQSRFDKDFKKGERAYHHLVVLAKNKQGYQNLCRLSSLGYVDGFYRAPRIDREILEKYSEGLIITTSCVGGSVPMNAVDGDFYKADSDFDWFARTFEGNFFVELQNHNIDIEKQAFEYVRKKAIEYKVPEIVTTDSHYLNLEDYQEHDALICIGTGQYVDDADRKFKFDGSGYHYHTEEEVHALFPSDTEAIYNTGMVADMVEDEVIDIDSDIKMPPYEIIENEDTEKFEEWQARGGLNKWTI